MGSVGPVVLDASDIAAATSFEHGKALAAYGWLLDRGDAPLFACAAAKLCNGNERMLLVSRYRLLLVRWKFGRPAFRELQLIDLRGITCEDGAGAWGFGNGESAQLKTPRLQEAARATLEAHAAITLCLDVPPLALTLRGERVRTRAGRRSRPCSRYTWPPRLWWPSWTAGRERGATRRVPTRERGDSRGRGAPRLRVRLRAVRVARGAGGPTVIF